MLQNKKETAIHIGINYAGTSSELNGCVSDSVNMLGLSNKLGIKDIVLMVDINVKDSEILNLKTTKESREVLQSLIETDSIKLRQPTKSNILNEIMRVVSNDDIGSLFLSYSGHGTRGTYDETNIEEEDRIDEYFCTIDDSGKYIPNLSSFILDDELFDTINSAAKKRKTPLVVTYVFDCCHSGTIFDLVHAMHSIGHNITFKSHPNALRKSSSNLITINGWSGCQDNQSSYEDYNYDSNLTEGHCTRSFINAIESIVLNNNNNVINHMNLHIEMMDYLFKIDNVDDNEINTAAKYQIPNYSSTYNIGLTKNKKICMPIWVVGQLQNISSLKANDIHQQLDLEIYSNLNITDEQIDDSTIDGTAEENNNLSHVMSCNTCFAKSDRSCAIL